MTDTEQYKPAGFTDTFTRIFSVITIIFSVLLFTGIMAAPFEGAGNLNIFLFSIGLHGVITNPYKVGSARKLLCNLSSACAIVLILIVIVRLFINAGLVRTDF